MQFSWALVPTLVLTLATNAEAAGGKDAGVAPNPVKATTAKHEGNKARIVKTPKLPQIDGKLDAAWQRAPWNAIDNLIFGAVDNDGDASGRWRGLWTPTHLIIFVEVNDDKKMNDSPKHWYQDDQIEMFFTSDNQKPAHYFKPRTTNTFAFENPRGGPSVETHKKTKGFVSAYSETAKGWTVELAIPFSDWNIQPVAGHLIGMDMNINDDDDGGNADAQLGWNGQSCCVGANPQLQGTAELVEAPGNKKR